MPLIHAYLIHTRQRLIPNQSNTLSTYLKNLLLMRKHLISKLDLKVTNPWRSFKKFLYNPYLQDFQFLIKKGWDFHTNPSLYFL